MKVLQPVVDFVNNLIAEEDDDESDGEYDDFDDFLNDFAANSLAYENDSKSEEEAKAEYKKNIDFAKSLEKKLKSSKKDTGFLYKELDKKRASKYKLVQTITEDKMSKFSDGHFFNIEYESPYYNGLIHFYAEFSLEVNYMFTDFSINHGYDYNIDENFTLDVTKVEVYSCTKYGTDEGELVIYTKDAGIIHIWYEENGHAVLRCGGLGTIEGTHSLPTP